MSLPSNLLPATFEQRRHTTAIAGGTASIIVGEPFLVLATTTSALTATITGSLNGSPQTEILSLVGVKAKRSVNTWDAITQVGIAGNGALQSVFLEGQPAGYDLVINNALKGRLLANRRLAHWMNQAQGASLESLWMGYFNDLTIQVGDHLKELTTNVTYLIIDNSIIADGTKLHHMEATLRKISA